MDKSSAYSQGAPRAHLLRLVPRTQSRSGKSSWRAKIFNDRNNVAASRQSAADFRKDNSGVLPRRRYGRVRKFVHSCRIAFIRGLPPLSGVQFAASVSMLFGISNVTRILDRVQQGELKAGDELLPLIYEQLRKLAAAKMANEPPGQTLQPTALVHEAWLRLSQQSMSNWKNREQFYAMAAEVMRRVLVDRARRRRSRKHGGDLERMELDGVEATSPVDDDLVLQVHDALERLDAEDHEKAHVVKLRFFVGLENAEIASLLGVSEKTVQRHWAFAKAWLARALQEGGQSGSL